MRKHTVYLTRGGRELIQNDVLLGNAINFKPQYMAYASKYKADLQKKIVLRKFDKNDPTKVVKTRTVYSSRNPLSYIQQRIGHLLSFAFDMVPGNEHSIAYRKGLDVRALLRRWCSGTKVLVKADITKYYDHVTRDKLKKSLERLGFVDDGPDVVSNYLTVTRKVGQAKIQTLQQGSAASCAAANIVGYEYFDKSIRDWLKDKGVRHLYYRYSDNFVLFLYDDPGNEWIAEFKKFVKDIAAEGKFRTHSWATIRTTNPARAQEFLGVVLNEVANVARSKRDWLRATLFRAVTGDLWASASKWCEMAGLLGDDETRVDRFVASAMGVAGYVKSVNPKHGKRLMKLAKLLERLSETPGRRLSPDEVQLAKLYRRDGESVERYLSRF